MHRVFFRRRVIMLAIFVATFTLGVLALTTGYTLNTDKFPLLQEYLGWLTLPGLAVLALASYFGALLSFIEVLQPRPETKAFQH